MKKRYAKYFLIFVPVQLVFLSVLIIYLYYPDSRVYISPVNIIIPTLGLSGLAAGIYIVFLLITRKHSLAGIYTSLIISAVLFSWRLFASLLVILLLVYLLTRWHSMTKYLGKIFAGMQVLILVVDMVFLLDFFIIIKKNPDPLKPETVSLPSKIPPREQLPDIYYIILDGYGRGDMLKELHGFDNSQFLLQLEDRGFFIPAQSQSNYPRTLLSLASSLNMKYLDSTSDVLGKAENWWLLEPYMKNSAVRSIVEQAGYTTVFLASGWDYTDIRDGDYYFSPYPIFLNDFEESLILRTNLEPITHITSRIISFPSYETHRRTILYQFQQLVETSQLKSPKFVFAHILSPHPPFVFDASGEPIDPVYGYTLMDTKELFGDIPQYQESYIEQLIYTNQLVLEMIDGILSNSITPPVIILQADHGPGILFEYDDQDYSCLYERYSILNAYLFPSPGIDSIPSNISPVNTFRLVFNQYLGQDYPLLPEKRVFSFAPAIYQYQDVTSLSEQPCEIHENKGP